MIETKTFTGTCTEKQTTVSGHVEPVVSAQNSDADNVLAVLYNYGMQRSSRIKDILQLHKLKGFDAGKVLRLLKQLESNKKVVRSKSIYGGQYDWDIAY
tara:strand:- start:780 stop:1076 length:297 start_codon:yes stop_codon:yes gene_type:complete